ncbi:MULTISPECIES: hypothetical protein [Actinoplanes]|uniref:hypothetical protein n=1 Tax=Actinoplanes TaxID=1865 RepID=UPI0012F9E056|nr:MULTISPECIES: hypothetical protein [Actinoplanes]
MLVRCLGVLRAEIDRLAPGRDRSSDGSVGDRAHRDTVSDHNPDDTPGARTPFTDADSRPEVHAIDVDASGPWPAGWSMDRIVATVVNRHRAGLDDRLQNVIHRRRIWSRSWGWTARPYQGAGPHTGHAHFSARYVTAREDDTGPWGLTGPDEGDTMTKSEFLALLKDRDVRAALCSAVLTTDDVLTAPPGSRNPDGTVNRYWSATSYLQQTLGAARTRTARDHEALAAAVVAALPGGGVTAAEVEQALVKVFSADR